MSDLHSRLVAKLSDDELERRAKRAYGKCGRHYWLQETLDWADRRAQRMVEYFKSNPWE